MEIITCKSNKNHLIFVNRPQISKETYIHHQSLLGVHSRIIIQTLLVLNKQLKKEVLNRAKFLANINELKVTELQHLWLRKLSPTRVKVNRRDRLNLT